MAAPTALMLLDERETILDYVYNSFNTEKELGLTSQQLQTIFTNLRGATLNLPQVDASIKYVCACPFLCDREELFDVLNEMDRRFYLAQDLQWEFALLDRQRKGAITKSDTIFLFKMVYGEFFSKFKFERMMSARKVVDTDVSFQEIEVALCNIPTHDWIDELMHEEEKESEEKEYLKKEKERKKKEAEESKRREEEMKQMMEEEDRKLKELLARKKDDKAELEKKNKEEEEALAKKKSKEEEEERLKAEELKNSAEQAEKERLTRVEKDRLETEKAEQERLDAEKAKQADKAEQNKREAKKAEQERLAAEKVEEQRLETEKAEQERLEAEKSEQERLEAEKAEQDRLEAEKAEQERLEAEKAEQDRLEAEKAEQERIEAEKTEDEELQTDLVEHQEAEVKEKELTAEEIKEIEAKKAERALQNWEKAKVVSKEELRKERIKKLHKVKAKYESEEASKQSENAENALKAEKAAEEELIKAEKAIAEATSEEEKKEAEEVKKKAKKAKLKNKEKRLRSTLKAATNLRSKPRIDVAMVEAKEALPEIPALKPDIESAEKVSDSIKCGDELEEAMAKRNLPEIESSIDTIKKKGFETEHTIKLLEAEKLVLKLKRLEKLKKEIMALDQRTISEIRSYKKPLPAIHDIMIATYVILGYKEKDLKEWKYIQALLGRTGKEGLKRQVTTLDASKINMTAANLADKKYLSKHDLGTITDISAGAATFYVWSTAMIEEARSWHDDSEFRKKLIEKRKKEVEESLQLEEEKKNRGSGTPARKKSSGEKPPKTPKKEKDGKSSAKPLASPNTAKKARSPNPPRKNLKPDTASAKDKSRQRSKSPKK